MLQKIQDFVKNNKYVVMVAVGSIIALVVYLKRRK